MQVDLLHLCLVKKLMKLKLRSCPGLTQHLQYFTGCLYTQLNLSDTSCFGVLIPEPKRHLPKGMSIYNNILKGHLVHLDKSKEENN